GQLTRVHNLHRVMPRARHSPRSVSVTFMAMLKPARVPASGDDVIHLRNAISKNVSDDKRVGEADEAAHEADSVADEKLAEKTQVRAYDGPSLEDEPVRRNEESEPAHQSCG